MNMDVSAQEVVPATVVPLSSVQQGIWLDQIDYESIPFYNIGVVLEIAALVQPDALTAAVNTVASQHDALRIVLNDDGAIPKQAILPQVKIQLRIIDVSSAGGEQAAWRYMHDQFSKPFLLGELPWAIDLIIVGPTHCFLLHRYHHVINDGFGVALHVRAVLEAYNCHVTRRGARTEQPGSYLEFIEADRRYLQSTKYSSDRKFWLGRFTDIPRPLFDGGGRTQSMGPQRTAQLTWRIPRQMFGRIQRLGAVNRASAMQVLLALIAAYLARFFRRDALVIGLAIHNRWEARFKEALGMFTSNVPVLIDVPRAASFEQLVKAVSAEVRACYRHQRFPIAEINRELHLAQARRRQLFDVSITYLDVDTKFELMGTAAHIRPIHSGYAQIPLAFLVRDYHQTDDILVDCTFSTAILDRGQVERMLHGLQCMLDPALHDAQTAVGRLPMLPVQERWRMLHEFSGGTSRPASPYCLHELFEAQVRRAPDALACQCGSDSLTYAQLDAHAQGLAQVLRARRIKPETCIAVLLERGVRHIVSILGILKAGGCYLLLDPKHPSHRLHYMLRDAGVSIVISDESLAAGICDLGEFEILSPEFQEASDVGAELPPMPCAVEPRHLAYVIYTSGSTGDPKGVMVSHAAIVNYSLDMIRRLRVEEGQGSLVCTSLSFDLALTGVFPPMLCGRPVILCSDIDPLVWAEELRCRRDLAPVKLTPSHLRLLLQACPAESFAGAIRTLVLGGEPLTSTLVDEWKARAPQTAIFNHYGPTEATVGCLVHELSEKEVGAIALGRPIDNTRVYVLDENWEPVPVGMVGELFIGGAGVARGYVRQPTLTAERFLLDPFADDPAERVYRTGDLARLTADGEIEYLGRGDSQIKIRGYRVEPAEIEAQLSRLPNVREAVVLSGGMADAERLLAFITLRTAEAKIDPDEVRAQLSNVLPDYMMPTVLHVVDRFSLTRNGKLDRQALLQMKMQPLLSSSYQPPVGTTEVELAKLWRELLGWDPIGRYDNFFLLGGHSLLAVQLSSKVRQVLHRSLSPREIFNSPTLQAQAMLIERGASELTPALPKADRQSRLPLGCAQQRLWFISKLPSAVSPYHVPGALQMMGSLDVEALRRTLAALVSRHESLRTVFEDTGDAPAQIIKEPGEVELTITRWHRLGDPQQFVASHAVKQASLEFDLTTGPLFRCALLQLGETEHILLLTLHHIISDGWSLSVLAADLSNLYAAFRGDIAVPLRPLDYQYVDFAVWQQRQIAAGAYEDQLRYWKEYLRGAPALLDLPSDFEITQPRSYRGATVHADVSSGSVAQLKQLAAHNGTTLFAVLLGVLNVLIARWVGRQRDLVIGTVVAGREDLSDFLCARSYHE